MKHNRLKAQDIEDYKSRAKNTRQIATKYGTSVYAIYEWLREKGVQIHRPGPVEPANLLTDADVDDYKERRVTVAQLAERHHTTMHYAYKWMKEKCNVSHPAGRRKAKTELWDDNDAIAYRDFKITMKELTNKYSTSPGVMREWLVGKGIAIRDRASRHVHPHPRRCVERDEAIYKLYQSNNTITMRDLAKVYGITAQAISLLLIRKFKECGAKIAPRAHKPRAVVPVGISPEDIEKYRAGEISKNHLCRKYKASKVRIDKVVDGIEQTDKFIYKKSANILTVEDVDDYANKRTTIQLLRAKYGVSDHVVRRWMVEKGQPISTSIKNPLKSLLTEQDIDDLYNKRTSVYKLAKRYKINLVTVGKWWYEVKHLSNQRVESRSELA